MRKITRKKYILGYSENTLLNLKLKEVIKLDENFDIECVQYMALESTILCDPEDYGLPEDKKYPMPDKKHVLLAIKFFNATDDPDKQKILAANINKRIKDFNMESEVNVGDKNNFKKFWKPSSEAVITSVAPIVPYQQPALKKAESVDDPMLIQFPIKKKRKASNLVANESIIFSQKDYVQNLDKWKSGPNNILYITGLSGSGKSTLAKDYAKKYDAQIIEIDSFEDYDPGDSNPFIKKAIDEYPEFETALKNGYRDKDGNFNEELRNSIINKVIKYVIHLCNQDREHLYIIEGLQLYLFIDIDLQGKPLIIKGTSVLSSESRAIKRAIEYNKKRGGSRTNLDIIHDDIKSHLPMNMKDDKKLTEFKKNQREKLISATESNLKSEIDPDYKPKGNLSLSKFKKAKVTEITKEMKESAITFFKHIDAKRDTTYVWYDGQDIVGVGSVRHVIMDTANYNWITAIQVNPKYKGYGLGKQILDFCVKKLNGDALTVAIDNNIAFEMYKKYGFKVSKESLEDVKAGRRKVYFMYLNKNNEPNFPIIKSKNKYFIKDENGKKIAELGCYDYSKKDFNWILFADIETDKAHRNQGLGSKLLNRAYSDVIKDNPKNGVYLMVRPDNKVAISFYKKNGFEFVKSTKLKDGKKYDLMCKGNADKNQLINMNYS